MITQYPEYIQGVCGVPIGSTGQSGRQAISLNHDNSYTLYSLQDHFINSPSFRNHEKSDTQTVFLSGLEEFFRFGALWAEYKLWGKEWSSLRDGDL